MCRRPVLKTAQRPFLRKALFVAIAASAVLAVAPAPAGATPAGALDPAFGSSGVTVVPDDGDSSVSFSDVALDTSPAHDGDLVAVGASGVGYASEAVIARFRPDGSLDATFGQGGLATSQLAGSNSYATGVDVDQAGRILVSIHGDTAVLARFGANGSLDEGQGASGAGFGQCGCGYVSVPDGFDDWSLDRTGSDAGQIIFAGSESVVLDSGDSAAAAVAGRLSSDGALVWKRDFALSADPAVIDPVWGNADARVSEAPNGDMLITGRHSQHLHYTDPDSPPDEFGAVLMTPDGDFDESYGTKGGVSHEVGGTGQALRPLAAAVDGAGGVVIAGSAYGQDPPNLPEAHAQLLDAPVMRLTPSGGLDAEFGDDGIARYGGDPLFSGGATFSAAAFDDQGRILLGGVVDILWQSSADAGVLRVLPDASPDAAFGEDGVARLLPSGRGKYNSASALTLDGRGVVVVGRTNGQDFGYGGLVARFLAQSQPDPPAGAGPGAGGGGVASELAASPSVDVQQAIVPKRWRKLIKPGVRVLAGCDIDCTVDVTVTVSRKLAEEMGVASTVVARGSGRSAAGAHEWIVATAPPKIRDELKSFAGHGKLHVAVTPSAAS